MTQFFRKIYLSLYLKGLCVRGSWRRNRFLSRSPGQLHRGPGGPASLGAGFLYRILSPTHLISKLTDFLSSPELYNNLTSTLLLASVTISHSFNPSTVKVIISWYSSTRCTCYLHWCISYFDSSAGSEVNIQHCVTEG